MGRGNCCNPPRAQDSDIAMIKQVKRLSQRRKPTTLGEKMSELASRYMAELTNEGMPCERCGGNGEVDNPKKDDPPMRWTTKEETGERGRMKCLACSGWFEKTSKCDSCGGTGWDFWVEKKTVEHVVWPATKITCPKCKGKAHYRTDAERLKEM